MNAAFAPIPATAAPSAVEAIKGAMAKYPKGLVGRHVKRIEVVGRMHLFGVAASGTYAQEALVISFSDRGKGLNFREAKRAFHHEFSSVLYQRHQASFPREEWLRNNPPGFVYKGSSYNAVLLKATNVARERQYFRQGFVCQYSQASLEDDFNMTMEFAMAGDLDPEEMKRYPHLSAKVALALQFVRQIEGKTP